MKAGRKVELKDPKLKRGLGKEVYYKERAKQTGCNESKVNQGLWKATTIRFDVI